MGRLNIARHRVLVRSALGWSLPVLLSVLLLFGLHSSVKADPAPSVTELQKYLQNNELKPYGQVAADYPQIFYLFNQQQVQLTTANYPHLHPVSSGQYVSWLGVINGQAQVYLYDVLTDNLLQLSLLAPNEGIYMYQNKVVWQSWDGQHWQVFYYDGTQVRQITSSDAVSSFRPALNTDQIIYTEQINTNDWRAQSYDISTGNVTTIRQGDIASTGYPRFTGNGIETAFIPR